MRKILILGATSVIAQETAKIFASKKDTLFLVARNETRLKIVASDLAALGAPKVGTLCLDLTETARHEEALDAAERFLGGLDTALIAYGTLGDQRACEESFEKAKREIETNFTSAVSLLTLLANRFEKQGHGTIAAISSVAGDRGRPANYVYGSAKAALSTFLSGLRGRLHNKGVSVLTIKPGYVDTPMVAKIPNKLLVARPQAVARGIVRAIEKRKDVVYLPWFWRGIMLLIKFIPEGVFKTLKV
jgi:hypothetical protein